MQSSKGDDKVFVSLAIKIAVEPEQPRVSCSQCCPCKARLQKEICDLRAKVAELTELRNVV